MPVTDSPDHGFDLIALVLNSAKWNMPTRSCDVGGEAIESGRAPCRAGLEEVHALAEASSPASSHD
jgi:hypothetical protein